MSLEAGLGDLLEEFASLSDADRKAILNRLSSSEREALQEARRQARLPIEVRALSGCSPSLAKQLLRIVQADAGRPIPGVTQASRQALRDALGLPRSVSNPSP